MKFFVLVNLFLGISFFSFSQDAEIVDLKKDAESIKLEADTSNKTWKLGGKFNLNVNQGTQSNWSAGGEEFSFSLNTYLNLFAFYKKNKHAWDNNLELGFGLVQTTSLGRRKSSDRIDYTNKYGYALSKKINLTTLANLRTQFANGYSYAKNSLGVDTASLTSKPFTPAYILFSQGFDFKPKENISLFCSPITSRLIIVSDKKLGALYGIDSGEIIASQLGAYFSGNYSGKIGKKFMYKTKLDLFSNYKKNPGNIDIFWTNAISAKITKFINFSFNVDMIYDNDIKNINPKKGPAPQWQQLMGIGFAYTFKKK